MESELFDAAGKPAGEITSVSPASSAGKRDIMAYLKRGALEVHFMGPDGTRHAVGTEN
jgi:hypothetical protein